MRLVWRVTQSNDLSACENLRIKNLVKKRCLAESTLSTARQTGTWLSNELNASGDMTSLSAGSGLLGKVVS